MSFNAPSLAGISPFNWRGAPRQTTNNRNPHLTKLHNGLRTPDNHPQNITVTGREQGQADAHRLDAIKRSLSAGPDQGCYFCDDAEATRKASL